MAEPPETARDQNSTYTLLAQDPKALEDFYRHDALFEFYQVTDKDEAQRLYRERAQTQAPRRILDREIAGEINVRENAYTLFTYMLRASLLSQKTYRVPVVFSSREGFGRKVYDDYYRQGLCAGMSFTESDFRMRCARLSQDYGLIELQIPPKYILDEGFISYEADAVPRNGLRIGFTNNIYALLPSFIGFSSRAGAAGFDQVLSTFDKQLYSNGLKRHLAGGESFKSLGKGCGPDSPLSCGLFFTGPHTGALLGGEAQPQAGQTLDPEKYLKVHPGKDRRPALNMRNTILSDGEFVNYGFYTEAELAMLSDLGYDINLREFYGASVYSSGTANERAVHEIESGFSQWNGSAFSYSRLKASAIPLTVGTHVYGSHNDVRQKGTIASVGEGAVGIRVDGSDNVITVAGKTDVIESGYRSSGVAVTYGRNNILNIDGLVSAKSEGGTGINLTFGSNALSDYREYRGSYMTVRTGDHLSGRLPLKKAQALPLDEELKGPLVSRLNIRGTVEGETAVMIDRTAHVAEINLLDRATVAGPVVSLWDPEVSDGELYAGGDADGKLLKGRLQLENDGGSLFDDSPERLLNGVYTRLTMGALPSRDGSVLDSIVGYRANHRANVRILGDVTGKSIRLLAVGGRAEVTGSIKVKSLEIGNSVFRLGRGSSDLSAVASLTVRRGGVLDLINGQTTYLKVDGDTFLNADCAVRVDVDPQGQIRDKIVFGKKISLPGGVLVIEPGVSYDDFKRYSSDPKAMRRFISEFMQSARSLFADYGITVRPPRYIWYSSGDMGREIRCSARDCKLGLFVSGTKLATDELPAWRYTLSAVGLIFLILFVFLWMRRRELANLARRKAD